MALDLSIGFGKEEREGGRNTVWHVVCLWGEGCGGGDGDDNVAACIWEGGDEWCEKSTDNGEENE